MIRNWFKSSKIEQPHPTEEELLRCVDGELSAKEAASVRSHLETCWNCRLQLEKLEGAISAFVEFRQQIQIPLTEKPPKSWDDFNGKLRQAAQEMPPSNKLNFGRFIGGFGKHFQISAWSPVWKSTVITAFAMILIFTIFWQFVFIRTISANELLDKASQFQSRKIKEVTEPVVYQKIKVNRQNRSEMEWEIWRDTTRTRFRQNIGNETNKSFNDDLWQALQTNGFNPQDPLSSATFANWRKNLSQKSDSVETESSEDGSNILVLKTVNLHIDSVGKIIVGTLKVKENDFHPIEQILQISTNNGIETYTFKELDFSVVSLNTLKPGFFPESVEPQLAAKPVKAAPSPALETNITPSVETNLATETGNTNLPVNKTEVPKITASADLEVEVLDLLNRAKADLGEQITVKREADGLLYVRGIVETSNRKTEIWQALQNVRNNPAVKIDIKTVDEAVAEQKSTPVPSGTAEKMDSQSSETAANSELVDYFKSEDAARLFSGKMVARSRQTMSRAYALKRLLGQFNQDQLRQLSPEAKAKLLSLISLHARAFREESESIRQELQPVFNVPNVSASNTMDITSISDIPKAVASLLDYAAANDRVIRSAFTISSGNARFTAIKTAQFWQSLKNAESVAAKLQSIK